MRKSLLMGALLLVATAAFAAAGRESAKVEIPYQVAWAGKVLPAGEYTFKWQEQGDGLDVTIMQGREVMAKGRGRLEQQPTKSEYSAVGTSRDADGSRVLTQVFFRGKAEVLVLAES
jgi:hypothetical protein